MSKAPIASMNLQRMMEQLPAFQNPQAIYEAFEKIASYKSQYQEAVAKTDVYDAVGSLYAYIDDLLTNGKDKRSDIKCQKGCAHCCRMRVSLTEHEMLFLLAYCKQHNIHIPWNKLRRQAALTGSDAEYMLSKESACVFLNEADNSCKVYAARPVNCRKYFVLTNPNKCKDPSNKVSSPTFLEVELAYSGMLNAGTPFGDLPKVALDCGEKTGMIK